MQRISNLIKAILLLACFPLLLIATLWATLMVLGGISALLVWAAGTSVAIPIPLYWADILPNFIVTGMQLPVPPVMRAELLLPAPVDVLWRQLVPLANAATHAATPYLLGFAAVWLLWGFRYQDRVMLMLTDARGLSYNECPPLYDALEAVCQRAGVKMPKLYMQRVLAPNAYASGIGPKTYSITITAGLLAMLDRDEVEAVLAHELSHIRNQDVRLLVIATVMVGMMSWIASLLLTSLVHTIMGYRSRYSVHPLLLPFVLVLALTLCVGAMLSAFMKIIMIREREMGADAGGARLTSPSAMASALHTIASSKQSTDVLPRALRDMVIYQPPVKRTWLGRSWVGRVWRAIWSTHPTFERRLAALTAMGATPRTRGPGLIRVKIQEPAKAG